VCVLAPQNTRVREYQNTRIGGPQPCRWVSAGQVSVIKFVMSCRHGKRIFECNLFYFSAFIFISSFALGAGWWVVNAGLCDSGILGGADSHPSDKILSCCLWQGVGCHLPPASPFCKGCQHDDNLSTFRLLVCSCICSCRGCTQTCVADMSSYTYTYGGDNGAYAPHLCISHTFSTYLAYYVVIE